MVRTTVGAGTGGTDDDIGIGILSTAEERIVRPSPSTLSSESSARSLRETGISLEFIHWYVRAWKFSFKFSHN